MNLEAVGSTICDASSGGAIFASFSAGDPYCPTHGMGPCICGTSVLPNTGDWTFTSTYTCFMCGAVVSYGSSHYCTSPGSAPVPSVPYNPYPNTFTISIPVPECAFCDKPLEADDKKPCKDCRGVFEAWKFLTKKDEPEPDKEPEGG
jgi:hypothetical protein